MKPAVIAIIVVTIASGCSLWLSASVGAQSGGGDPFEEQEGLFDALDSAAEGVFDDRAQKLDALWDRMEAEEEAKWKRLEAEVLQKWDAYRPTTKKIWVDYSDDREAVSQVNFETGEVVVEALVPEEAPPGAGQKAVVEKVGDLMEEKDAAGERVMEGMLPETVPEEVATGQVEISAPEVVEGKDGVRRVKVGVRLNLVPDHLQRRAARFLPRVEAEAGKRGVEPALVMAVIHTESAFNPKARSPVPAYGLMQLVPRFAAKEAYQQLYGVEKVLTPDYLYNPDYNIELGVTYLGRLLDVYFGYISDPEKRRYVAVCAYNWGPTAMKTRLLVKMDVEALVPTALYERLLEWVPEETRHYLERVEKRRTLYTKAS